VIREYRSETSSNLRIRLNTKNPRSCNGLSWGGDENPLPRKKTKKKRRGGSKKKGNKRKKALEETKLSIGRRIGGLGKAYQKQT